MTRHRILMSLALAAAICGGAYAQQPSASSETQIGRFLGAADSVKPDWFKESFLDFEEDIAEAAEEDKRLILYFHQDGCPYCNKLIEDNFADPVLEKKVRDNFDLVAINMWGDREVVQVGGQQFTEKTLAAALNVNFTPTLLFFSEDGKVALRLDGYYPSGEFLHALDYVSGKNERNGSYAEYLASLREQEPNGSLNDAPWLMEQPYRLDQRTGNRPLAVLFEEPACEACDLLHQKSFTNESADELLETFDIVQFNRWSDTELVRPDGTKTTAKAWATELDLGFAPSIVLFNEVGEQVLVVDAMFKTFHILGALDYVASSAYQDEPSFQRFLSERAEHIRATGKDVDIWSY